MFRPTARPGGAGAPGAGTARLLPRALGPLVAVVVLCLPTGCRPVDPARGAAEHFIDRYYVEIDLPQARQHAEGFAGAKIDREMVLLEGIGAAEANGKPQVNYRFLEERAGSDEMHRGFLYELSIRFGGGGRVDRRALVTVRGDGGDWKVTNFQELD